MDLSNLRVQGKKAGLRTGRSGVDAKRPTLILTHGSGGSSLSWLQQLNGLDGDMNVIAPDLPGHGDTPGGPITKVEDYVSWITEFIEAAGLGKVILLGHSLGGAIAQRTALDRPDLLKALVLVGTGARLRVTPQILDGIKENFDAVARMVARYCYTKDAPADLLRQATEITLQVSPDILHGDFSACNQFDVMNDVERIDLPTLILVGSADVMTPVKYSQYLHEKIKGSKLEVIEGQGHGLMHQAVDAFNKPIISFVKSL